MSQPDEFDRPWTPVGESESCDHADAELETTDEWGKKGMYSCPGCESWIAPEDVPHSTRDLDAEIEIDVTKP